MKRLLKIPVLVAALCIGMMAHADFALPYGLASPPDSTLVIGDVFDSAGGDREESIARFSTSASRQDSIEFYTLALEKVGFEIYSSSDTEKRAMIAGKRADDRVTVYFKDESDWAEAGESEISVHAVYNK
ncbi:hypothetical protein [Allohahella marinimesophila]|uniref:Uncharacterized protein n=1 Tax=Allohahella marinimesophila TaxID=1054972 RepID=A0ABP7PSW9_9GAMM